MIGVESVVLVMSVMMWVRVMMGMTVMVVVRDTLASLLLLKMLLARISLW
jgi:hypothetical protein